MRTNNKLAIAIAATIFSFSATETVLASGLTNYDSVPAVATWYSEVGTDGIGAVPADEFLPATSFITDGTTSEVLGVLYATEIFGSDPGSLPETLSAAVIYEIDGAIDEDFYLSFTLSNGATFGDTTLLVDSNSIDAIASISSPNKDGSTVKYTVSVNDTGAAVTEIPAAGQFLLAYKLENTADALGSANGKITMTVEPTSVGQTAYLVNVSDEITVARSAQAVSIDIDAGLTVDTKIATAAGGTEFTQSTDSTTGVYITQTQARIGTIVVSHYTDDDGGIALGEDGTTQFVLGAEEGEVSTATLTITDGQFAASATDPGSVYLDNITAETTVEDGTTATITLDDVMGELAGGDVVATPEYSTLIRMDLDGVTEVNIPENAPCATLTVDYSNSNIADINVPSDGSGCVTLPKIPQDGTTCWVNIVPKSTAATDALSILITNNTNDEAELTGTMYAQDGTTLFSAQTLKDGNGTEILGAGKTMRLTSANLGMLMDGATEDNPGTWTGRSALKITTTLSSIEILALIRDMSSNINSNVSQGSIDAGEVLCK